MRLLLKPLYDPQDITKLRAMWATPGTYTALFSLDSFQSDFNRLVPSRRVIHYSNLIKLTNFTKDSQNLILARRNAPTNETFID